MYPQDADMPSGLTLILTPTDFEIISDDGTVARGSLRLENQEDWLQGCPTGNGTAELQTAVLEAEFDLGPHRLQAPWLTPDCTNSDDVYLSTIKSESVGPCVGMSCFVFEAKKD